MPKILGYKAKPLPVAVWDFIRSTEGELSVINFRELRKKIRKRLEENP
ncbi:MAG: hypothetical protein QXU95_06260 [Candidatus Bathyarchaeia archaeon]